MQSTAQGGEVLEAVNEQLSHLDLVQQSNKRQNKGAAPNGVNELASKNASFTSTDDCEALFIRVERV